MENDFQFGNENEEEKIKQALLQRPGFSIKARLTLMLFFLFFLIAVVVGASMFMLSRIDNRIQYIFLADQVSNEIQHARRIEKNYFLYNSELLEIREHIGKAQNLLDKAYRDFGHVVGKNETDNIRKYLNSYSNLAEKLIKHDTDSAFIQSEDFSETAREFRAFGSKIMELSLDVSKKERQQVSQTVSMAQKIQFGLIIMILASLIFIFLNLTKHILSRLNRLVEATQRVASGDFSPITPSRKYKDEFSFVAIALNHMMYEIDKRQNQLVEAHKFRAIGNLTAGVAHELNNPLNNIIITSEMMKEDFKTLNEEDMLDMINDLVIQGERARQVVKNLLDFARESKTTAKHFNIDTLIDNVSRLVKNQIKLNKVKMDVNLPERLPPIYGDLKLLTQVFLNLFSECYLCYA